jgi:hypothetical protein
VLAYVFWHRPGAAVARERYEQALLAFQRSLRRSPPVGLAGAGAFRVAALPWSGPAPGDAYEDWYLLEDYAALGVLREAAVGRGHRTAHEAVARISGFGAGGLYELLEGEHAQLPRHLLETTLGVWVTRPLGASPPALAELLADGMDPARSMLFKRELVLGPAPELCVLGRDVPQGASASRLPAGWSAQPLAREALPEL